MKISLIYMHPRVVLTGPERKNRGFNVGESSAVLFSSLSFFHALIYAIWAFSLLIDSFTYFPQNSHQERAALAASTSLQVTRTLLIRVLILDFIQDFHWYGIQEIPGAKRHLHAYSRDLPYPMDDPVGLAVLMVQLVYCSYQKQPSLKGRGGSISVWLA